MRAGWRPIADFEADPKTLTDGELESLSRVWADQKVELSEEGTLNEFDKRLRREWSIETGIIEGVYTLDRGVTRTLIEKGIDAALIPHDASNRDSVVVARIIQDHYDALDGLFDFVGGQRKLSTGYIKELHAALLCCGIRMSTRLWTNSGRCLRNRSKRVCIKRCRIIRRAWMVRCMSIVHRSMSRRRWTD